MTNIEKRLDRDMVLRGAGSTVIDFIFVPLLAVALALLLGLTLPACTTKSYHGIGAVQIHTHTLNTKQPCLTDPEVIYLADVAAALYLAAASRMKLVEHEEAAKRLRKQRPFVCLVETREPCRIGRVCALGSDGQGGYKPDCSDKAGCAGSSWAWAARDPEWRETLVHELGHALAYLWGVKQTPEHVDSWQGVEAEVRGKLVAAGLTQ